MDKLNACGWDIRISHHSKGDTPQQQAPGNRLIGVISMEKETYFAVINPGYVGRIIAGLLGLPGFKEISWYISDDDYFKKFQLTRSLRGIKIGSERLEELKKMMKPIVPKEGMII